LAGLFTRLAAQDTMLVGKPSTRLLTIRQENLMSDLVAIVYPSEAKAEEVRQRLFDLRKQYLIDFSDAVISLKTDAARSS
jgi:hypothetical protein